MVPGPVNPPAVGIRPMRFGSRWAGSGGPLSASLSGAELTPNRSAKQIVVAESASNLSRNRSGSRKTALRWPFRMVR